MPNNFPARDRKFISNLADDLHLELMWDEYDDEDQNLVTFRFPGALDQPLPSDDVEEVEEDEEDAWEDEEDENEEGREAVDRVLNKYEKAKVTNDADGGGFDARYENSIKLKMDEWKQGYYQVRRGKLYTE